MRRCRVPRNSLRGGSQGVACPETLSEGKRGQNQYFAFYITTRPHQAQGECSDKMDPAEFPRQGGVPLNLLRNWRME